jgi:creatinine amidohydrolase/Fe(II)-dependent formamide hydrolase-like protein
LLASATTKLGGFRHPVISPFFTIACFDLSWSDQSLMAYNLSHAGTFPQFTMTPAKPEEIAREQIDAQVASSGWVVQDMADLNLSAASGVAVREFPMARGYGFADWRRSSRRAGFRPRRARSPHVVKTDEIRYLE